MVDLKFSLKIEQYVGRKVDFDKECLLWQKRDGSIAIASWNIDTHAEPTIDQLAAYEDAVDVQVAKNIVLATRKVAYPRLSDQLDMLWHAIDTGDWTAAKVKTTEFYTALKAVKDANPKP